MLVCLSRKLLSFVSGLNVVFGVIGRRYGCFCWFWFVRISIVVFGFCVVVWVGS